MKLWYSPASPFVRKVLLLAHEAGLQDRVKRHNVSTGVTTPDAANPGDCRDTATDSNALPAGTRAATG